MRSKPHRDGLEVYVADVPAGASWGFLAKGERGKGSVCCLGWQRLGGGSVSASDVGPRALVLMFFNEVGVTGSPGTACGVQV